jgi:hypothetical protein
MLMYGEYRINIAFLIAMSINVRTKGMIKLPKKFLEQEADIYTAYIYLYCGTNAYICLYCVTTTEKI